MPAHAHAQHSKLSLESIGPAGGNGAFPADLVGPLDANKRVLMTTAEHLTSSDTDSADDVYSRTGGTTTLLSSGSTGGNGAYPANFGQATQAGSRLIFQTDERLVSGDTDDSLDVYERASGTTTLVSTGPAAGANGAYDSFFAGASSDGSRIFFTTRGQLVGSDTDQSLDVYERSSGSTSLISIGPAGGNGTPNSEFAGISDDGTKVFFETRDSLVASDTDSAQDVYQHSGGTTTLVSTGPTGGNGTRNAFFDDSSLDGSRVFFHTDESLTAADTDSGEDVYERSGGSTIVHSIGPTGGNSGSRADYVGSSQDGTKVYIETMEKLVTTDKDSFNDVYISSGGTLTLPAPGGNDNQGAVNNYWAGNSADGSKLFIRSEEALAAGDTDQYQDVFEYSGGVVTRLSLGPSGGNGPAHAFFAGASTDGARVFFQTYEALAATDTDTNLDIYERYGGTTYQVGSGNGAYDATFRATSPDGDRVYFRTDESLLAADTDGAPDIYSASISYARPKGATPIYASLVPAYEECTSPNRTHGPSLVHPSCNPPVQRSSTLTVGTPDTNGAPAQAIGSMRLAVMPGIPSTPADEADVGVTINITDVRCSGTTAACPSGQGSDYNGKLLAAALLRITDKRNGPSQSEDGTVADTQLEVPFNCTTTADTGVGATCAVATTIDALLPGAVAEGKRAIWGLGAVTISDSGPNGTGYGAGCPATCGDGDETVYMKQGIFIP